MYFKIFDLVYIMFVPIIKIFKHNFILNLFQRTFFFSNFIQEILKSICFFKFKLLNQSDNFFGLNFILKDKSAHFT